LGDVRHNHRDYSQAEVKQTEIKLDITLTPLSKTPHKPKL